MLITDGVSGRLFPVDDIDALTTEMEAVLNDPDGARLLGERARQTVAARYDIATCAERWLDAYREVLNARRQ